MRERKLIVRWQKERVKLIDISYMNAFIMDEPATE